MQQKIKKIPMLINSNYGVNTSQNGSSVRYHLSPSIDLNGKKAIFRILKASIWWSIPNVSSELNNNTLYFTISATPYTINFQKGLYDLTSLNSNMGQYFINNSLSSDTIQLTGDSSTNKISVQINDANLVIDWDESKIRTLLGYDAGTSSPPGYVSGPVGTYYEAPNIAQLNTINSLLINTNFTTGFYYNSNHGSSVSAVVTPDVPIGSQIVFEPQHPIEVDVFMNKLDEINIFITDENFNFIDTNQENFQILGEIIMTDEDN